MRASRLGLCSFTVVIALLIGARANAGPLNGNGAAYTDPSLVTWTGSTPFAVGTLTGFVDWSVFAPGAFPYVGYTPTGGEMTYAYQVYVTGAAPLSSFSVFLTDPADNIGSFVDLPGVAPNSASINPMSSADWTFPGIPTGSQSRGLAFSSPRVPQNLFGVVVDTGQSTFVIPLPSPSANYIPEPVSLSMLALGLPLLRRSRR